MDVIALVLALAVVTGCAGPATPNARNTPPPASAPAQTQPEQTVADLAAGRTAEQKAAAALIDKDNPSQILFWSPAQQLAGYRGIRYIYPTRTVKAGNSVLRLPAAPKDFSALRYQVGGSSYSLTDYIAAYQAAGLIIVQDGNVLFENYTLGNNANSRWISFSIAKSVTSMLIGAAIQDGYIKSLDEPITDYLPRLKNSSYDRATIRNVLQMASGVRWNEDYADPNSDVSRAGGLNGLDLFNYLGTLPVDAVPGQKFNYNTGETHLVGALLRAAIGNNAATYLTHKIWIPFGMEADADWMLNEAIGGELGGCCISATLRDYARIGLFALNGGVLADGSRVLPDNWMNLSTTPSQGFDGYGYLWWLTGDGSFSARGIFGQMIFIDPDKRLVIALHSSWPSAVGQELAAHRAAVIEAIRAHVN